MTANEFLKLHKQDEDSVDIATSLEKFWQQMRLGLNGEDGGLPMIPTYLMDLDRSKIKAGATNILIDAGGTNFRSAIGYFDELGNAHIDNLTQTVMPASKKTLGKDKFYGAIASNISHLLPKAQNVGFCFSYQVDMGRDLDGTVVMFSKEIKAPEVVGTRVGQETLSACKRYDKTERKIVVLNDTVATLLGGMATTDEKFGAYLGYIYGTGTNVCYVEDTANITKVNGLPAGKMLVNTECGNFEGFEQGDFDKAVISRTAVPDKQLFEKMTSGKYLADIIHEALVVAHKEKMFVSRAHIVPFTLQEVSEFLSGGKFCCKFHSEQDKSFARDICIELIRRAAKMGAIVNAALAVVSCRDTSLPIAIVCEGTTFNKLPHYRNIFESYLTGILTMRGIRYKIVQGEDLNLVGTLMATMMLK